MGSTFSSLRIHIVFSTKERLPWIKPEWRSTLHEYLGGTVRGLGAVAEAIGGVEDHRESGGASSATVVPRRVETVAQAAWYRIQAGTFDVTRSGIPSGCFALARSSNRGSKLRSAPRLLRNNMLL